MKFYENPPDVREFEIDNRHRIVKWEKSYDWEAKGVKCEITMDDKTKQIFE